MIKNVLVADDERTNAVMLARTLEKEGYKVYIAGDGLEALDIIKTRSVDLLITDVVMPKMDGVDLYMELKGNPITASLPVIIVTDKEVFKESFHSLGVELFCPKPFNMEVLLDKIKKVETQAAETRAFHKIVVIGPDRDVLQKMNDLLKTRNAIVAMIDNVFEVGLRCFLFNPRMIIIDLHTKEYATTKEIIRSIRSYEFFKHTAIVVYSKSSVDEIASIDGLDSVDVEAQSCLDVGATVFIGRFNPATFLAHVKEFGI